MEIAIHVIWAINPSPRSPMTRILHLSEKAGCGATFMLDSGEPCVLSVAQTGVRVRQSRRGFMGPSFLKGAAPHAGRSRGDASPEPETPPLRWIGACPGMATGAEWPDQLRCRQCQWRRHAASGTDTGHVAPVTDACL
jgi:hypothetical protein